MLSDLILKKRVLTMSSKGLRRQRVIKNKVGGVRCYTGLF